MIIGQMFPTLIGIVEFGNKWEHLNKELESVKMRGEVRHDYDSNWGTWSESTYVLDDPVFADFKQDITDKGNEYFENVLCHLPADLRITQSWVSVKGPSQAHWPHKHPNSVVSGVYYWQDDIVPIVFTNDRDSDFHLEHDAEKLEAFDMAQQVMNCYVQKNSMVLFESRLMHGVGPNHTDKDRYSMAFNMFPSKLGNREVLSELNLNNFR